MVRYKSLRGVGEGGGGVRVCVWGAGGGLTQVDPRRKAPDESCLKNISPPTIKLILQSSCFNFIERRNSHFSNFIK